MELSRITNWSLRQVIDIARPPPPPPPPQWYRSFLRDDLQYEPLIEREGVQVRMNLGQLLLDSGDLDAAIAFFTEAYDKQPHDHVAKAILRIAECHLDLAAGQTDRDGKRLHFEQAEEWVRRLFERMPSAPEITPAPVLLGRAMLGQAFSENRPEVARDIAEKCQKELAARVIRLFDSVEMLDVWLLAGQAQFFLQQPDRAFDTMLTLRESPYFGNMGRRQFLDYHFLLGYGAQGLGKHDLAMRSLEWFLTHAEADPRRGQAYVLLAESYLAQKRFVQARPAAVEARQRHLGYVTDSSDCNDLNAAIHPGAIEIRNGKDDDCEGLIDEISFSDLESRSEVYNLTMPRPSISIFPNPANSFVQIKVEGIDDRRNTEIMLVDAFGRVVFKTSQRLHNASIQHLLLSNYYIQDGIYVLRLRNNNSIIDHKILIQKN